MALSVQPLAAASRFLSEKSHRLCEDKLFVIDELQSSERWIVDTDAYPSKRRSPE
jgi:hypothetical protein